jgi:hypothetical protein
MGKKGKKKREKGVVSGCKGADERYERDGSYREGKENGSVDICCSLAPNVR